MLAMIESAPLGLLVEVLELWEVVDPALLGLLAVLDPWGVLDAALLVDALVAAGVAVLLPVPWITSLSNSIPEKGAKEGTYGPGTRFLGGLRSLCELGGIAG